MDKGRKCIAVIRIRGISDIRGDTQETMDMLHLTRNCHATLIDDRPSYLGMLRKAQSYLTWGEVSKEAISILLKKRARTIGDKKLTDEYAQRIGYKSLDELTEAINNLEIKYKDLPDIKPIFRLHPPKGGFKGKIKRGFVEGGAAGYRGENINNLLENMI